MTRDEFLYLVRSKGRGKYPVVFSSFKFESLQFTAIQLINFLAARFALDDGEKKEIAYQSLYYSLVKFQKKYGSETSFVPAAPIELPVEKVPPETK